MVEKMLDTDRDRPGPGQRAQPEPSGLGRPAGTARASAALASAMPPSGVGSPAAARGADLLTASNGGGADRARVTSAIQRQAGNTWLAHRVDPGLTVSHPADPAEREAEAVAHRVAGGSRVPGGGSRPPGGTADVHRAPVGTTHDHPGAAAATAAVQGRGAGHPVSPATRRALQRRMGTELGDARVHSDAVAADAADALGARAFTHGRDIFLARGESEHDPHLMAHELTHVVQNRSAGSTGASVSRLPAAPRAPATPASAPAPVPAPATAPARGDVAPGIVELKGQKGFTPDPATADFLARRKSGLVNVRFGALAQGAIEVRVSGGQYVFHDRPVPLSHPLFARIAEAAPGLAPSLILTSKDGVVSGHVGVAAEGKAQSLTDHLRKAPEILGLAGIQINALSHIDNTVEDGTLRLGLKSVPVTIGSAFDGTITLQVTNETVTFEGSAQIQVAGLASGTLEMTRPEDGVVTGHAVVDAQLSKQVTGHADVNWDGHAITGEGKLGYQGEKFSGSVTVYLMERAKADALVREKKAPTEGDAETKGAAAPAAPAKTPPKGRVHYAVFGEGDLTFAFNEWLTGTAHAILDHEGHLTVIGKITPQKEFELFPQKNYDKELFKVQAKASYGIPVVGNIFIFAGLGLSAFAYLGPGKFYNIVVDGTYSTDPKVSKNFSIQGSINISAAAGLKLRAEAGAGFEILDHDIKAGAGVNGIAGIKGYAEATPKIGYRENAAKGEDKKGEFFIRGDVEIAAQPFLGLSGDVFVEIDAPWWSPVPDKKWVWPLGEKEWPIGGSFGFLASVDYVFGSKSWPTVEFKPAEFQADKFMSDLYADKTKDKAGEHGEQKGAWHEKNSEAAEPPKPGGGKGAPPTGKPLPTKGEAKAAPPPAAKSKGKPADPNAKTADGKTVKELQDKAAAHGKKPPVSAAAGKGAESKGSAKTGSSGEEHDKKLAEGLRALDAVTARYARDGATKDEIVTGVKSVRRKFTIFKSIEVTDGGDTWDYDYVASNGKKKGPKKSGKSSIAGVHVNDEIEVLSGTAWYPAVVTKVEAATFEYRATPLKKAAEYTGLARQADHGTRWRRVVPGRSFKRGKAWEAIRDNSENRWSDPADAKQVLNWRRYDNWNTPKGYNWHHIHEFESAGPNSADNLVLITSKLNAELNTYYGRPRQKGMLSLRQWLRAQGSDTLHQAEGRKALETFGTKVVPKRNEKGYWQEGEPPG
jgi:hypothetical protein